MEMFRKYNDHCRIVKSAAQITSMDKLGWRGGVGGEGTQTAPFVLKCLCQTKKFTIFLYVCVCD